MVSHPVRNRILKSAPLKRKHGERGTAVIEFVLVMGMLVIPVFFGVITVGLSLVLANQVTEVCRDTGHMFAYGVDFSQSNTQTLVTSQLAQGLGMSNNGGRGVIYLSTITYLDSTSCSSCTNMNHYVVVKRLTIGNTGGSQTAPAIQNSSYAPAITPGIIKPDGTIPSANYLTDASVQADAFATLIAPTVNQQAFVSEMFIQPPAGGLWALFGSNVLTARSIF